MSLEDGSWNDIELPYDTLMSLPYLDAVVRETLRVYPPSSLLSRTYAPALGFCHIHRPVDLTFTCRARQTTTLPLQFPVVSSTGEEVSSVVVPEGTTLIISILAANHNKAVWGDDASEWRPERWLKASGQDRELDGALGDSAVGSTNTPGNRGGVKYPGVYASMSALTFRKCPVLANSRGSRMTFLGGGRACVCVVFPC
jgi:cytochrome P450